MPYSCAAYLRTSRSQLCASSMKTGERERSTCATGDSPFTSKTIACEVSANESILPLALSSALWGRERWRPATVALPLTSFQ